MTTAAGLALARKPCVSYYLQCLQISATPLDQIRNSIGYPKLNVKIAATHGGITVGEDESLHQALEDVSLCVLLPDMTVIIPSDYNEVKQAVKYALEVDGPCYIRVSRTNLKNCFDESNYKFNPKNAVKLTRRFLM